MTDKNTNLNAEAQFDVLPVLGRDRIYSFGKYTYVIVGFAMATWCFMIGGSLSAFVGFKTAIIASVSGNLIAVLIMIAATVVPAARYGIDNYTIAGSFLAVLQACWVIVFSFMVSKSVLAIYAGITGNAVESRVVLTAIGLAAALAVWFITVKGPKLFDKLNMIFAPMIIILMVIMIFVIGRDFGFDVLMKADPITPLDNKWLNFLIAFELSLGAGFSWWPNMGGLARLCKTERAAFWPNIIGLVFGATLGTSVGVAAALLIGSTDPTTWMIPIGGSVIGILALIAVGMANLTAVAIVSYNICLGFKQWKVFSKMSWVKVTGLFMCIVFIGMFFAVELYNNFYIILGLACTVYSPIIAMQLIDFYVVSLFLLGGSFQETEAGSQKSVQQDRGFRLRVLERFQLGGCLCLPERSCGILPDHGSGKSYVLISIPVCDGNGWSHHILSGVILRTGQDCASKEKQRWIQGGTVAGSN